MGTLLFLTDYLIWHYGRAPQDLLGLARDLLWSCWHFFSISDLARTLFAPFARIRQTYFNINNLEESFQNLTANAVSRAVGLVLRTIVIVAGLVCEVILAGVFVVIWAAWFLLPAIIILLLIPGSGML
ncbi:MAG: hypothetical protein HYT41_01690 [Candidatus Sungbacteria bacterium]|nr:hypothetical protein [Candidatus Sungbacteria bacterium]